MKNLLLILTILFSCALHAQDYCIDQRFILNDCTNKC